MNWEFEGKVIEWRGPAPFVFARTPDEVSEAIREVSKLVTYGWGAIPALVVIGQTEFRTALFPKDGVYLVPIKVGVQRAEGVKVGDRVSIRLALAKPL
jgi:hypothetical protein